MRTLGIKVRGSDCLSILSSCFKHTEVHVDAGQVDHIPPKDVAYHLQWDVFGTSI